MTNMFCDEPIIAGYHGSREYDDIDGGMHGSIFIMTSHTMLLKVIGLF